MRGKQIKREERTNSHGNQDLNRQGQLKGAEMRKDRKVDVGDIEDNIRDIPWS